MSRGKPVSSIFRTLAGTQCYLGKGLHTLGMLQWILSQCGRADVYVSTFSTSEAFLSGFLGLRKKGLVKHAVLLADLKASKKTVELYRMMSRCFDDVYLSQNHSKVVLVDTGHDKISVITSQNQTYGDRAEATLLTDDKGVFDSLMEGFKAIATDQAVQMDGLFERLADRNRDSCPCDDEPE